MSSHETARRFDAPQRPAPAGPPEAWLRTLDAHAMEHGFHARLGDRHGALYTEDDESLLLVSFENAGSVRARTPDLPYGLSVAGKAGWSQLTLYSEGDTWFRDPEVYAFFDDLVDDGFFDLFDNVLFYGAGPGGYAACAYSVAAPGARVVALRPQATLDPARAGWDRRHLSARRLSFTDRYGDAAVMLEAAERATVIFDPRIPEDAMHAVLLGAHATLLRTPFLGPDPEHELETMGVLDRLLRLAARDRLDGRAFAELYRRRHRSAGYLRRVLGHLERAERPFLQALWCRAALRHTDRPRLRQGLAAAEDLLASEGRSLPAPRSRPCGVPGDTDTR